MGVCTDDYLLWVIESCNYTSEFISVNTMQASHFQLRLLGWLLWTKNEHHWLWWLGNSTSQKSSLDNVMEFPNHHNATTSPSHTKTFWTLLIYSTQPLRPLQNWILLPVEILLGCLKIMSGVRNWWSCWYKLQSWLALMDLLPSVGMIAPGCRSYESHP